MTLASVSYARVSSSHHDNLNVEIGGESTLTRHPKEKEVRVISLDGGGARFMFTATLLKELEKTLQINLGNVFDVWGGNSAGAIAVLGLNRSKRDGTLYHTAKKIADTFPDLARQTFSSNPFRTITYNVGLSAKYSGAGLAGAASFALGNTLVEKARNPILIPVFDITARNTCFVTKESVKNDPLRNLSMQRLLLMTSAAPTYFPPVSFNGHRFCDGGLFANNPTLATLNYARELYGEEPNYTVCSFGAGKTLEEETSIRSCLGGWGALNWAPYILSATLSASEDAPDIAMRDFAERDISYFRWQNEVGNISVDDCRDATLEKLRDLATTLIKEQGDNWNAMIKLLQKAENQESHAVTPEAYT